MAKNLRAKIPEADELFVCDTKASATESFLSEARGMRVQVARSPREVAEKSVCLDIARFLLSHDEQIVLSMI